MATDAITTHKKDFDPNKVSSEDLVNQPVVPFDEPISLTTPERDAQAQIDRIRGLTKQLQGQSEFRTEQQEEAGVEPAEERVSQLEDRLFALQNRAEAIPIEEELQALENPPTGRAAATRAIRSSRQPKKL